MTAQPDVVRHAQHVADPCAWIETNQRHGLAGGQIAPEHGAAAGRGDQQTVAHYVQRVQIVEHLMHDRIDHVECHIQNENTRGTGLHGDIEPAVVIRDAGQTGGGVEMTRQIGDELPFAVPNQSVYALASPTVSQIVANSILLAGSLMLLPR